MLRKIFAPIVKRSTFDAVRSYRRDGNRKPRDLAGIRIQQGIFNNTDALKDDPEITYDADFAKMDQSYDEYENEERTRNEQVKRQITKQKYFKPEKQPNFLTWAEKEQIRYLNKQDPEEWTPEQLAKSFPAVEEVIQKIIKATWTPANMDRVKKHDEGAKKNWELFKANQLNNLDPDVRAHLEKFSNRSFDSRQNAYAQTNNEQIEFKFPKPKGKEFLRIVSSCKKNVESSKQEKIAAKSKPLIDSNERNEQALITGEQINESQIKLKKSLQSKVMTYDDLMNVSGHTPIVADKEVHLSVSLPKDEDCSPIEEPSGKRNGEKFLLTEDTTAKLNDDTSTMPMNTHVDPIDSPPSDIGMTSLDEVDDSNTINLTVADVSSSKIVKKYEARTVSALKVNSKHEEPFKYKIKIPHHLRKSGKVYKLYDCFYDDTGDFLYRVPGLTT